MSRPEDIKKALKDLKKIEVKVDEVISQLRSARRWGAVDLVGGGFITGTLKHRKMNRAKKKMNRLEKDLKTLKSQLREVDLEIKSFKEAGFLHRVMDVYFDHIVFDISSQSKIRSNIKELEKLKSELKELEKQLKKERDEA